MVTLSTLLWAGVCALAIATAALLTNPGRSLNRCLGAGSLLLLLWLGALHGARVSESARTGLHAFAWAALAWSPLLLWLSRDVLVTPGRHWLQRAHSGRTWVGVASAGSVFACLMPFLARQGGEARDWSVAALCALGVVTHAILAATSYRMMVRHLGASRLDIQLLALGGVLTGLAGHTLLTLLTVLPENPWTRLMPLVMVALWGGTVWSLLTTRILDVRQLLTLGAEKLILVSFVALFIWGVQQICVQFTPEWLSFGVATAMGLWFAAEVRPWLQQISQRKASGERLRKAATAIATEDLRPELMEEAFCRLAREWACSEKAIILISSGGRLAGPGVERSLEDPEIRLLHALRWVTPERLARERPRPHGDRLASLMQDQGLSAIIASPSPTLNFVLAVGTPRHHRPFIFPEIGQLLGLQAIIESALARAHYLMKAQHAEQLATVGLLGASIAHEIRNPLVSIKTFVQLLPNHYQEPAFRDKFFRLIGDEVGRIDRMTEQLLDLSAPRVFAADRMALHPVLSACIDLISAKAEDKHVEVLRDFQANADEVFSDPNAIKQVVLNLGFNAIQALEHHQGPRKLWLRTRQTVGGVELVVEDNGPGISMELWEKLFQPFQTTKSSGFGLGLAICKDILSSLHATISADAPGSGTGATFRINLPCQPPSS